MTASILEKIDEKLSAQGWFMSSQGLEQITQNGNIKDLRYITQTALDCDLKEIGKAILAEQLTNKLVNNVVLQIQKTRNISAPKANEDSQAAPRMLKLNLTDGHTYCQAIETDNIGGLNLHKTAPGTKLLLKNAPVINGYLFLKPEMAIVLGGKVQHMYEKWEVNKNMCNVKRNNSDTDGPPAWVNFGKKIAGSETKDFKSLEDKNSKEDGKPSEFDVQRNVAIAEATTGAVKKVFGGGTKPLMKEQIDGYGNKREPREFKDFKEGRREDGRDFRESRDSREREPREFKDRNNKFERRNKREPKAGKDDVVQAKPSDKVSLFAFLEDKLPDTVVQAPVQQQPYETKSYNNYNQRGNKGSHDTGNKYNSKSGDYRDYKEQKSNHYQNDYNKYGDSKSTTGSYKNDYKSNNYQNDYKSAPGNYQNDYKSSSNYPRDNRRGNQPPRLQNKQVHQPQQPNYNNQAHQNNQDQNQYQQFPQPSQATPPFHTIQNSSNVDDLTNKMDRLNVNASFAKNAFKQHLNLPNQSAPRSNNEYTKNTNTNSYKSNQSNQSNNDYSKGNQFYQNNQVSQSNVNSNAESAWKFNIGDLCMAKYWEDNKYYNATITGLTAKTCVVRFNEYGNMEEVLLEDCLPVMNEESENNSKRAAKVANGNEYRGNRNFVNRNRRH